MSLLDRYPISACIPAWLRQRRLSSLFPGNAMPYATVYEITHDAIPLWFPLSFPPAHCAGSTRSERSIETLLASVPSSLERRSG